MASSKDQFSFNRIQTIETKKTKPNLMKRSEAHGNLRPTKLFVDRIIDSWNLLLQASKAPR